MISTIKALTRNRKIQYLPTCNRFPWQQISGTLPVLQQGHKLEAAKHFQKINRICKDLELTGHDYYLSKAKCRIANYDIPMWPLSQSANNARVAFKGSLHFHIFTWMFHPTHPTLCLPDPLSFMFHLMELQLQLCIFMSQELNDTHPSHIREGEGSILVTFRNFQYSSQQTKMFHTNKSFSLQNFHTYNYKEYHVGFWHTLHSLRGILRMQVIKQTAPFSLSRNWFWQILVPDLGRACFWSAASRILEQRKNEAKLAE